MSSPMYDMPDHFPMPINVDGQGPANPDETVAIVCWCGDANCEKFKENNGSDPS